MKGNLAIFFIFFIASFLMLANLSNQYLWQDEGETAMLAKNTLKYGYPRAYDGVNLINPTIRTGYGPHYEWLYHPWMQFYIAALSFLIFGQNTFSARILFAILGIISIILVYILSMRLTKNKFASVLASGLTTFTVPYILLMRQARYYAPSVVLVLLTVLFYLRFIENKKNKDLVIFFITIFLLGYTVHGFFMPVFAALGLHYFLFARNRETNMKVIITALIVICLFAPWFVFANSLSHAASITFERITDNIQFQIRMINKFIFPLGFFLAAYVLRGFIRKNWAINLEERERKTLILIGFVISMSLALFTFVQERNFRYLVYLIPLFAIIEGIILLRVYRFNKFIFSAFLSISIFTGLFNSGYPTFYFPKYLYEITHDYDGPIEGIVTFLKKNASSADEVKIIYGDLPIMFYTGLKVDNSNIYDDNHMPKWIVFRNGWHEQLTNTYYTKAAKSYKKHILDYPDIVYENRPDDMGYHRFATDKEAPRVVLFEKMEN